jgi:diacylglycerol kinase family enzyme
MIKKLALFERFSILLKVPEGKHINDKRVNYYQTRDIILEFPEVVPFHVDGELNFSNKFNVKILSGAIKIIYNPDGNHFFKR